MLPEPRHKEHCSIDEDSVAHKSVSPLDLSKDLPESGNSFLVFEAGTAWQGS